MAAQHSACRNAQGPANLLASLLQAELAENALIQGSVPMSQTANRHFRNHVHAPIVCMRACDSHHEQRGHRLTEAQSPQEVQAV